MGQLSIALENPRSRVPRDKEKPWDRNKRTSYREQKARPNTEEEPAKEEPWWKKEDKATDGRKAGRMEANQSGSTDRSSI